MSEDLKKDVVAFCNYTEDCIDDARIIPHFDRFMIVRTSVKIVDSPHAEKAMRQLRRNGFKEIRINGE